MGVEGRGAERSRERGAESENGVGGRNRDPTAETDDGVESLIGRKTGKREKTQDESERSSRFIPPDSIFPPSSR